MYICYIDANCVGNIKQNDSGKLDLLQFSLTVCPQQFLPLLVSAQVQDIHMFQKIISTSDIFSLLVKSICPNIFGNHLVKAGLVLAMFGGGQKSNTPSMFVKLHPILTL